MPKELDLGLTVTVPADNRYAEGNPYTLRLGDCTGLDDLDVERETGRTVLEVFSQVARPGMQATVASVVVWLVRRRNPKFQHTTFRDVAQTIKWGDDWTVDDADKDSEEVPKVSESEGSPPKTDS